VEGRRHLERETPSTAVAAAGRRRARRASHVAAWVWGIGDWGSWIGLEKGWLFASDFGPRWASNSGYGVVWAAG
jgi:hypothetical protein